jgi:cobalt-zinc-cadmium efflux system outer membrane protein
MKRSAIKFSGILAMLTFSLVGVAQAQAPATPAAPRTTVEEIIATKSYTLNDLLLIADARNHQLAAQRQRVAAARGRLRQAGVYPNPEIGADVEDVPASSFDTGDGKSTLSLSQPLIIGKRRRAAIAAEQREIELREAELEAMRHEIFGEVQTEYIDLLYNRDGLGLQWELLAQAQELEAAVQARHGQEKATDYDVTKVKLEVQTLEQQVLGYIVDRTLAASRLGALLGDLEIIAPRVKGALETKLYPEEIAISIEESILQHPQLVLADKKVAAQDGVVSVARAERVPDLTVSARVGYDGRADESMVGAGVSIPIPIFDRKQGTIEEQRSLLLSAENERAATYDRLKAELDNILQLSNEQDTLSTDYREKWIPPAEEGWKQALEGYKAGRVTLLEAIDTLRNLVRNRKAGLEYMRSYNIAIGDLRHFRRYAPQLEAVGFPTDAPMTNHE